MKLFVVIGLGQFGRYTAKTLYSLGGDVIAVDSDESRVEMIKDEVTTAVCADARDMDALRSIGVMKADTAVLSLGEEDIEDSIMCCSSLSELGLGRIIVRASSEQQGKILLKVGASKIIYPEQKMGEQLAKFLMASGVLEQVTLPTGQIVAHVYPRKDFIGKTLEDCKFQEKYRLLVIGIQKPKRRIDDKGELHEELILDPVPNLDTLIDEEDILVVVGNQNQIEIVSHRE